MKWIKNVFYVSVFFFYTTEIVSYSERQFSLDTSIYQHCVHGPSNFTHDDDPSTVNDNNVNVTDHLCPTIKIGWYWFQMIVNFGCLIVAISYIFSRDGNIPRFYSEISDKVTTFFCLGLFVMLFMGDLLSVFSHPGLQQTLHMFLNAFGFLYVVMFWNMSEINTKVVFGAGLLHMMLAGEIILANVQKEQTKGVFDVEYFKTICGNIYFIEILHLIIAAGMFSHPLDENKEKKKESVDFVMFANAMVFFGVQFVLNLVVFITGVTLIFIGTLVEGIVSTVVLVVVSRKMEFVPDERHYRLQVAISGISLAILIYMKMLMYMTVDRTIETVVEIFDDLVSYLFVILNFSIMSQTSNSTVCVLIVYAFWQLPIILFNFYHETHLVGFSLSYIESIWENILAIEVIHLALDSCHFQGKEVNKEEKEVVKREDEKGQELEEGAFKYDYEKAPVVGEVKY